MTGWRPALRIARRSIRRSLGRSLLVAVLVAVPVAGATLVDVLVRTVTAPAREAARTMGSADAMLAVGDRARLPDFQPGPWPPALAGPGGRRRDPESVDVAALLPAGARIARTPARYEFALEVAGTFTRAQLVVADAAEPLHRHEATLTAGRAPAAADEVAVSAALAERTGIRPGTTIVAVVRGQPPLELTVTALGESRYCLQCEDVIAAPGSRAALAAARALPVNFAAGGVDYLVDLPPGADADALWPALAERGVALTPRDAFLHPERYDPASGTVIGVDDLRAAAMTTLLAGLGLLEVVLLAGTAFAVGARRQTRELGLVAASGGSAHHVRRIVLAQGLVLGALGALLGVVAGFVLAIAGRPVWEQLDGGRIDAWAFGPWEIAAAALIGLLSGLAAAVVPAIGAGRMRPVDALAERFRVKRSARRRGAVLGGGLVVAGAVLGLAGDRLLADDFAAYTRELATAAETGAIVSDPTPGGPVALIVAGAALLVAGLLVLTPAAIGGLARLASRLPLSARLAVRDAARHRHRTGPATSAIGIAVAGSVVLAFLFAGSLRAEELMHIPIAPPNVLLVEPGRSDTAAMDRIAAQAVSALPDAEAHRLRVPVRPPAAGEPQSSDPAMHALYLAPDPAACERGCVAGLPAIAGDDELNALAAGGGLDDDARAALARGRVVVLQPAVYRDGHVVVEPQIDAEGRETAAVRLPAHLARRAVAYGALPSALIPEAVAREHGWDVAPARVLVRFGDATPAQVDALLAAAERVGVFADVEDGPETPTDAILLMLAAAAGFVTLVGVAISVALSAAEGRADLATLAAVGAPPHRRRALAAAQALLVAGLGCSLGVGFGAFVAFTARATTGSPDFVVPWANLGVTMVAVPLLATLVAAALVPSRLPLVRRAT